MNIGRFFLDVRGTITGQSYYNYLDEVARGKILLQKLIAKDQLDELRVSIVSTDCIESVEEYARLLEQRLSGVDKLCFGHHHADCKMMHIGGPIREDKNSKGEQMIANLRVCEHKICYYADDCKVNRIIAKKQLAHFFPTMKVVLFNPRDKALQGLNSELEKYLS